MMTGRLGKAKHAQGNSYRTTIRNPLPAREM